jgi:hypothetical protein
MTPRLTTALALLLAVGAAPVLAQNAAGGVGQLSVEQQTDVRAIIAELQAEPFVETDPDVSVGATAPDGAVLQPLPSGVAEIAPDYAGHLFFVLADGRIAIVEPDALQIVLIISA